MMKTQNHFVCHNLQFLLFVLPLFSEISFTKSFVGIMFFKQPYNLNKYLYNFCCAHVHRDQINCRPRCLFSSAQALIAISEVALGSLPTQSKGIVEILLHYSPPNRNKFKVHPLFECIISARRSS